MKHLTTMTVILAVIMFAVPSEAGPLLQDGLISVWSFDEASGTTTAYDTGSNSNHAVFSAGMATTGSDFTSSNGLLNNYLQFNGAVDSESIALINPDSSMDAGNQMTFSTWIKMDYYPASQVETWVGIFDSQVDDFVLYTQGGTASDLRMKLTTEMGNYRITAPQDVSNTIPGSWAHVAVVYDGKDSLTTRMYVNGEEVNKYWGLFGKLNTGQTPSFGGVYNPETSEISGTYTGGIDETGLWNRALNPDEIAHLYNGGSGNAIMNANPESNGVLAESQLVVVPKGTPLIQYDFNGNLNNSGSLGASYHAVHTDGAAGTLTYETSVLNNNGINLDNGGNNDGTIDGDRLVVPFELSSLDAGTITFWVKENANFDWNNIFSCNADANDWEMWIYNSDTDTGKYKARLDSGTVGTNPDPAINKYGNGLDEWNHYAFSWYRDTEDTTKAYLRLFLNGTLVSRATSSWQADSGTEFYLGGGSGNDFASWSMDDFRLYEGALDTDSIIEIATVAEENIPGDANRDGKVDGSDVTILANHWQEGVGDPNPNTITWDMGDFNGDGQIDGSDVTILANHWQEGVNSATAAVPEPSTVILILSALAGLGLFLRRR